MKAKGAAYVMNLMRVICKQPLDLQSLRAHYSFELCGLLAAMVTKDSTQRPASREILKNPLLLNTPHTKATQPKAAGLPMPELIQVMREHPQLKSQIQAIVSREDLEEAHKMVEIQRIVREAQPAAQMEGTIGWLGEVREWLQELLGRRDAQEHAAGESTYGIEAHAAAARLQRSFHKQASRGHFQGRGRRGGEALGRPEGLLEGVVLMGITDR